MIAQEAARGLGVTEDRALRFAARLPTVGLLAALLAAAFAITRLFAEATAAHMATIFCALDPNLIAHSSLTTVDTAYALATLLSLTSALAFWAQPSLLTGMGLGIALGFAFATKFTAVLLVPGLLFLPLAFAASRTALSDRLWRKRALGTAAAVLVAGLVLCSAYLLKDVGIPFRQIGWRSAAMSRLAAAWPGLSLPLPAAFLTGLDLSMASEAEDWSVILLGQRHPGGVWYYFLVLWLIKTPLLILLAELWGLLRLLPSAASHPSPWARYLGLNVLLYLAYFSLAFRAQIGYRFVLMCVPLVAILAASGLATLRLPGQHARLGAAAVLVVALFENGMYFGNPLSFTNAAVWPKRQAFRLIADSNIDWGQNRDKIDRFLAEANAPQTHLDPVHVVPGHNTFDLNVLAGVFNFEQHRWLREHASPKGHFGHTYLWFDVDNALFDQFLAEARSLSPGPEAARLCPQGMAMSRLVPGGKQAFSTPGEPEKRRVWIACVETAKGAEFGLRSGHGRIRLAPCRGGGELAWEMIEEGEVAWYWLEPGRHALCATEVPNRRTAVSAAFDGRWLVRGHAASLGVQEAAMDEAGRLRF